MPLKSKAVSRTNEVAYPRSRILVFLLISTSGCTLDLLTKYWVFSWRGMPRQWNEWWIWEGFIGIETATNKGALFGFGQGWTMLFVALSFGALLAIGIWLFLAGAAADRFLCNALALITGGILGNLYDRLGLWTAPGTEGQSIHEVRDWILLRYHQYTWPNFNIADCLLVCGAALLVWHSFSISKDISVSAASET